MKASISPEAELELIDAAIYYAREADRELGFAFVAEFERVLNLLSTQPQLGVPWGNNRRRFPLRRFPYSLVYYLKGDEVRIVALAHHRREPYYWSGRR